MGVCSSVEFEVAADPITWKRASRNGKASYTDPRVAVEQQHIALAFQQAAPRAWPTDRRYELHVGVAQATARRSDLDNYAKLVMDALEGHAYDNDAQIDRLVVVRYRAAETPGWRIRIEETS